MYWHNLLSNNDKVRQDYHLVNGIYRNSNVYSMSQEQTSDSVDFKWKQQDTFGSEAFDDMTEKWLTEKYFDNDVKKRRMFLQAGENVLDAGCGASYSAQVLFGEDLNDVNYLGVDVSSSVDVAKKRFAESGIKGEFLQTSLTDLPFTEPLFDVIFSEGGVAPY